MSDIQQISVIMATYRRHEVLNATLESFSRMDFGGLKWDLWVVDNAGDVETEAVVDRFSKNLPVRFLIERKRGKNSALNRAIPETRGDLLVFSDDDVLVNSDWLIEISNGVVRWPQHDVFGGRIELAWPDDRAPQWGDSHPFYQSLFGLLKPEGSEGPRAGGGFIPYGANMAVRRRVFDQGYRYDSTVGPDGTAMYRMGSEAEFVRRLMASGLVPVYLPGAVVRHQIRPEQLTMRWIAQRSFRSGATDYEPTSEKGRTISGISLYLWKRLVGELVTFLVLHGSDRRGFEARVRLFRALGKTYAQAKDEKDFHPRVAALISRLSFALE